MSKVALLRVVQMFTLSQGSCAAKLFLPQSQGKEHHEWDTTKLPASRVPGYLKIAKALKVPLELTGRGEDVGWRSKC